MSQRGRAFKNLVGERYRERAARASRTTEMPAFFAKQLKRSR